MIKLKQSEISALLTVILHTRHNLSWGEGGSFIKENGDLDSREAKKAERGIDIIKRIILIGK